MISVNRMALSLLTVFSGLCSLELNAQEPPTITQIEEDWVLQVSKPDPRRSGPQVVNVISPVADVRGGHAMLTLNHQTEPVFGDGGLQLQFWKGDRLTQFANSRSIALLATEDEQITYTLKMKVADGRLTVNTANGTSTTWGSFGGERMTISRGTSLQDLGKYSPNISAKHSKVSYGGNRVRQMTLKEVRYLDADGKLVTRQELNRVVHSIDN